MPSRRRARRGLRNLFSSPPTARSPSPITFLDTSCWSGRSRKRKRPRNCRWCARELVGDEPFAVILPDDMVLAATPCLKQLIDAHARVGGHVVAVEDIP